MTDVVGMHKNFLKI